MTKEWIDDEEIVQQMIKGSLGTLWGNRLESSDHYPILKNCLDIIGNQGLLIDLGCGAGDVSRVWRGDYIGVDLDWVIEKVAKVCNKSSNYLSADLSKNIPNLPESKCILMNAFLDVQKDPLTILEAVLENLKADWVVIHRQKIGNETGYSLIDGYGNSSVPASVISYEEINRLSSKVKSIRAFRWTGDYYTFLMEKNEVR